MGNLDRAVVFLDPWATEASWTTVEAIANTKKIDCWILFPLMAVTRMMPVDREPRETWANHLDRIFGGRKYWLESYEDSPQLSLLDNDPRRERAPGSEQIADRYKERLRAVFHRVAEKSLTLKNSRNSPLFELFFRGRQPQGRGASNANRGSHIEGLVTYSALTAIARCHGADPQAMVDIPATVDRSC